MELCLDFDSTFDLLNEFITTYEISASSLSLLRLVTFLEQ
jgi:hypothetical protein